MTLSKIHTKTRPKVTITALATALTMVLTMVLTMAAVLAVASAPAAQAAGDRQHRGHEGPGAMFGFGDPERLLAHMTHVLDLDDAQQKTISNIITAAKPEIDALRERARDNFEAMRALDPASDDYAVRLQNLASENGQLASEATLLHGRLRAEIDAELSPEQRQALADREAEMKDRFESRLGRRSPAPGQ